MAFKFIAASSGGGSKKKSSSSSSKKRSVVTSRRNIANSQPRRMIPSTIKRGTSRGIARPSRPSLPYSRPYSGGGGGGGGGGGVATPVAPPKPQAPSKTDWLAGDSLYQAQKSALKQALDNFLNTQTQDISKYNVDFGDALKNLGWLLGDQQKISGADPFNTQGGTWNETDLNTASGRSLTNQMNDFASRGMIQSSGYATARDDLMRSLNDQLSSLTRGRSDYLSDLAQKKAQFSNENKLQNQQAQLESLARRTAQFNL